MRPERAVEFRDMVPADIEAGLRMCRVSNWNQVRRDWEMFLMLSPRGCRVAVRDGQVIGTVATINYEDRFAWIAMVLVDPAARGRGIGTQLVREALTVLSAVPCIRLDATPAGQPVYRQLGFVDEYAVGRMAATITSDTTVTSEPTVTSVTSDGATTLDHATRPMTRRDLTAVLDTDRDVFGADRRALIEWQLEGAPEYAWVHERDGGIAGYVLGRKGFNAVHVGPVIATDQHVARSLVTAAIHQRSGTPFIVDATRHDPEWNHWLESLGFRNQRPFMRMARGAAPAYGLPKQQWAMLGPEFG